MVERPPNKKKPLLPARIAGGSLFELPSDDMAALEAFCSAVVVEEIAFEQWAQTHHRLDILLHLTISVEEWALGGEKSVDFARSVVQLGENQKALARFKERVSLLVRWPAKFPQSFEFLAPGLGDVRGEERGTVRVRVEMKPASSEV